MINPNCIIWFSTFVKSFSIFGFIKIQNIEKLFKFLLEYSYLLIPFLSILSYLIRNKRSREKSIVLVLSTYGLVFFLLLHFSDIVPRGYGKLYQSSYTLIEYYYFSILLYHFINEKQLKKLIITCSLIFTIFQVIHFISTKNQKLDSISIGIETIFIFLFIFIYFRQFFKLNVSRNIYEYQSFWIIVGILLYLGCGFFFNILVNYIPQDQFLELWHYTYIPEIIKNIIFTLIVLGIPTLVNEKHQKYNKIPDVPNLDLI